MNKFWFFIIAFCLVLSSCSKDLNIDNEIEIDDPTRIEVTNGLLTRSVAQQGGLDLGCFSVQYPFTLIELKNNANVEHLITSDDDFNNLFTDSIEILDFKYPITIDKDGVISQVDNIDALSEAFAECTPEGWSEDKFPAYLIDENNSSCYILSFPVSLEKVDGTKVSATDKDNFNELISTELYFFDFPLTLKDETSANIIVNDADELFTLLASCGGIIVDTTFGWGGVDFSLACYEVKFPMGVIKNDGSTKILANLEDFYQVLLEGEVKEFAYPLTLIKSDGTEIVVSNEQELDEAIEECFEGGGGPGGIPGVLLLYAGSIDSSNVQGCFTVNFPIFVTIKEGGSVTTKTLNNSMDLASIQELASTSDVALNYPITVVKNKNNQTVFLNQDEDLLNLILNCE